MNWRRVGLFIAVSTLAACTTLQPTPESAPIRAGRLAVRVDATAQRPSQNFSAAFELQGQSERGVLRLLSPIGTEVARVRWQPGQAVLTTGGLDRPYATLDDLADEVLGERVPLAALTDWIEGRPWARAPHNPNALGFSQMGWEVDLSGRAERRITARRNTPPAVVLRVVLDEAR
jgi:outer membrane lipoprotein LolB